MLNFGNSVASPQTRSPTWDTAWVRRVALQAATMTDTPPKTLILLGTQVNLITNQQAEFFTGTSDADLEWVQALGPENPKSECDSLFQDTRTIF